MTKGDWLGEFEMCVLLAVAGLGDDAYGLRVMRHLEEVTGRRMAIGAVYNTLSRLRDKGLLRCRLDAPRPVRGGRTRTCFQLTSSGTRALRASTTVLQRMISGWKPTPTK